MSQEFSNSAGLQFNSVYEKGSDGQSIPTSLILPENGSFHFDSNIEFSFEIYFRKKDPFGFILSATNKNESNYLILSYSDYRNPDTSYIDLTIEGNVSVISIPVPDILWAEFSWKLLSIQFNYSLNKIGLSFDNSSMTWYKAKMPIHRDLQFQFGRISQKVEPPRMVIRNINLNENSKSNIHWPLNEISGDIAIGSMENGREYPGKVKNANWLRRYHFQWRKVYSQDITGKDFQNTQIRFQPEGVSDFSIIAMEFSQKTNELMLVVRTKRMENNKPIDSIEYYSLNLPLTHIEIIPKTANNHWIYILLVMGLGSAIWFFLKNRVLSKKMDIIETANLITSNNPVNENQKKILEKGVTVQVFGTFRMWVDCREIHFKDWRSKKARELFIFILLKNDNGVSIKDINQTFWPNVTNESAVNSRAVTLNKIRKVIFPYRDLITKVDDRLYIRETEMLYSDYLNLHSQLQNGKSKKIKDEKWPILLHGKRGVLPDMHDDWVDLIRIDMLKSVVRFCKTIATKYIENKDWENLVWIGKRILELDQFDDDGLLYAIKGSKRQMKEGIANKIYADYNKKYMDEIGEPYNKPYDTIGEF
jgi:DNA-binding SARP family transcriptional activator